MHRKVQIKYETLWRGVFWMRIEDLIKIPKPKERISPLSPVSCIHRHRLYERNDLPHQILFTYFF